MNARTSLMAVAVDTGEHRRGGLAVRSYQLPDVFDEVEQPPALLANQGPAEQHSELADVPSQVALRVSHRHKVRAPGRRLPPGARSASAPASRLQEVGIVGQLVDSGRLPHRDDQQPLLALAGLDKRLARRRDRAAPTDEHEAVPLPTMFAYRWARRFSCARATVPIA